jgi:hypothetical protein
VGCGGGFFSSPAKEILLLSLVKADASARDAGISRQPITLIDDKHGLLAGGAKHGGPRSTLAIAIKPSFPDTVL